MIYDANKGNTGIFFFDHKDAEEYCALFNETRAIGSPARYDYSVRPMTIYDSVEDYKNDSKESFKIMLSKAIEGLTQNLRRVKNNEKVFKFYLDDEYRYFCCLGFNDFNEIINNNKFDNFVAQTSGNDTAHGWEPGTSRELTRADLAPIIMAYQEVQKNVKKMQDRLNKYKEQYTALTGGGKNTDVAR